MLENKLAAAFCALKRRRHRHRELKAAHGPRFEPGVESLFLIKAEGRLLEHTPQSLGIKMRKINDPSKFSDCTVRDSLSTIKATHVRLHLLNGTCATPALLLSQIELYDRLLGEISGIHSSLAKDLAHTRVRPQDLARNALNA